MGFWIHVKEAFTNLFSVKLRSFLAILGVLVGTGSVVALISSSQLATAHALEQFKTLGTNLISMNLVSDQSDQSSTKKKLTLSDIPAIKSASPQIVEAAPYISLYQNIVFHGVSSSGQILGVSESFFDIAKVNLQKGRKVTILDKQNYYCIIGHDIAKKIKAMGVDPMYKEILVGNSYFTIVGIADAWQPNIFLFADINTGVIIPLQTSYLISSYANIENVLFRLVQNPNIPQVQAALTKKMKTLFPNANLQFRNPEQIINIVAKQRVTFTWLLAAIGGIALIVGGIGVMNIMLVSVVERRREIGIRMAVGARSSDIMKMFLIEAVILTVFGGLIGIMIGVAISYILAIVTKWEFHFYILPPLLGFIVSVIVGIISGFYPAFRASRLNPIQTLTEE